MLRNYSDGEETNSELPKKSSSQSSMSSNDSCLSLNRLSFDALESTIPHSPENLMLKPHRSSDSSWQAIRSATFRRTSGGGRLGLRDFSLVRQIGSGDIGKVYLCRLRSDESCYYAMKVVNKEVLALKRKLQRAETETLHTEFEATHFSCVVMEFCPGGDLHSLRHKQPHKRFSIRFSSLQGSFTSNSVLRSLFCDIVAKSIRLSINKVCVIQKS